MLRENKDLMTDQDLRDLVAAVSVKQAELAGLLLESKRETDRQIQETARQLREVGRQLQMSTKQLQVSTEQLRKTNEQFRKTN